MPLRITHLSHNDQKGGGPLASYRLHRMLLDMGTDSHMLVMKSNRDDPTVEIVDTSPFAALIHIADRLAFRSYRRRMADRVWSPGLFGIDGVQDHRLVRQADIICLYWVNGGFMSIGGIDQLFQLNKPVVWRLSDCWPFTGGCHHPGECVGYEAACGQCPQLGSHRGEDLSAKQWRRKRLWSNANLTVVAPSRWLADLAGKSALFGDCRIEHITTGIDLDIFRPRSRKGVRSEFGLPLDRRLILFGANNAIGNPRKGSAELIEALKILHERGYHLLLVLFGCDQTPKLPLELDLHDMGVIDDEATKAKLFAAVDLFVTPSLEENLPNTVIEALASGTPAVAFDVGGTAELIEHGKTGYLASAGDSADLAKGIETVLETLERGEAMGVRARDAMCADHDQRSIAGRYLDLYDELHESPLEA